MLWESSIEDAIEPGTLKVLCGTWNVNDGRPSPDSLHDWLGGPKRADDADLAVIGLQEIEVGPLSVARAAAIDLVSKSELQVIAAAVERDEHFAHALKRSAVQGTVAFLQILIQALDLQG